MAPSPPPTSSTCKGALVCAACRAIGEPWFGRAVSGGAARAPVACDAASWCVRFHSPLHSSTSGLFHQPPHPRCTSPACAPGAIICSYRGRRRGSLHLLGIKALGVPGGFWKWHEHASCTPHGSCTSLALASAKSRAGVVSSVRLRAGGAANMLQSARIVKSSSASRLRRSFGSEACVAVRAAATCERLNALGRALKQSIVTRYCTMGKRMATSAGWFTTI
eukprot:6815025-Prymnesium_polylepis.3